MILKYSPANPQLCYVVVLVVLYADKLPTPSDAARILKQWFFYIWLERTLYYISYSENVKMCI